MALGTSIKSALNNINAYLYTTLGFKLGDWLEALETLVTSGNLGITAKAWDVDGLCLDGVALAKDADNTSGLTFGFFGGRCLFGQTIVTVADGTVVLTPSAVNYVEVDSTGTVSAHTAPAAFTAGRIPLYRITCGASEISLIENMRVLLVGFGTGMITGTLLSTAQKTRRIHVGLGTVNATTSWLVIAPAAAGTLVRSSLAVSATVATSDANYWELDIKNKGPGGAGTTDMLDTGAVNSTKATGGSALTAYVKRNLTLHGTPANLVHAAEDVLVLTATKTASGADLEDAVWDLDFTSDA